MLRSSSEDLARLLAKLPKHQNLIAGLILTAGASLGMGLLIGQLLAEGKLSQNKVSSKSNVIRSSSPSAIRTASATALLAAVDPKTKVININTASIIELDSLPGIGLTYAQKIVSARPFNSINELLTKKIIPITTYNKIKAQIGVQ